MTSLTSRSKDLARWLRHRPGNIGIKPDGAGWVDIGELLEKAAAAGFPISADELQEIVRTNDKKRFTLSEDGQRIRAAQGHSYPVSLNHPVRIPPPVLWHGTGLKFLESIRKQGLLPVDRHDVHLSTSKETALSVGSRKGRVALLMIETYPMVRDGYKFRCSENGVWLTHGIPSKYIKFPD